MSYIQAPVQSDYKQFMQAFKQYRDQNPQLDFNQAFEQFMRQQQSEVRSSAV
jgi:hypothetical protein